MVLEASHEETLSYFEYILLMAKGEMEIKGLREPLRQASSGA